MTYSEVQFGVLCDRSALGLGRALLCTALTTEAAWVRAGCGIAVEHPHVLVRRRVAYSEWSDPIGGETSGRPAAAGAEASG